MEQSVKDSLSFGNVKSKPSRWGEEGGNLILCFSCQFLSCRGAYIPNLDPLLCLEPLKKFSVGGWRVTIIVLGLGH